MLVSLKWVVNFVGFSGSFGKRNKYHIVEGLCKGYMTFIKQKYTNVYHTPHIIVHKWEHKEATLPYRILFKKNLCESFVNIVIIFFSVKELVYRLFEFFTYLCVVGSVWDTRICCARSGKL